MSEALAGDRAFVRALLAFVAGEVACDKESTVSGGTDLVLCAQQATTMAVRAVIAPRPHVHYYMACADHAGAMIGALHGDADAGLFFELERSDHDESCTLIEVETDDEEDG